jgi:hypothetical protein
MAASLAVAVGVFEAFGSLWYSVVHMPGPLLLREMGVR